MCVDNASVVVCSPRCPPFRRGFNALISNSVELVRCKQDRVSIVCAPVSCTTSVMCPFALPSTQCQPVDRDRRTLSRVRAVCTAWMSQHRMHDSCMHACMHQSPVIMSHESSVSIACAIQHRMHGKSLLHEATACGFTDLCLICFLPCALHGPCMPGIPSLGDCELRRAESGGRRRPGDRQCRRQPRAV
jgi:hypothetical protein